MSKLDGIVDHVYVLFNSGNIEQTNFLKLVFDLSLCMLCFTFVWGLIPWI